MSDHFTEKKIYDQPCNEGFKIQAWGHPKQLSHHQVKGLSWTKLHRKATQNPQFVERGGERARRGGECVILK